MATLTIEGREVDIDDGFLALSPEEQERTVGEIAASLSIQPAQQDSGTPSGETEVPASPLDDRGAFSAFTQGGQKGAFLGFDDEIGAAMMTPVEMTIGAFGSDDGKSFLDRIGDGYGRALEKIRGDQKEQAELHPYASTGGEIAGSLALAGKGMGQANSLLGRMAIGAGEGVAFGGTAGFGSGEGFEDRMEKAESGAKLGALFGAGLPAAFSGASTAAEGVRRFAAPFTKGGQERMAGERISGAATDAERLRAILDGNNPELVAGSKPTTFQLTGDMGIGGLERGAQTRSPVPFQQRRADQNVARVSALDGIQPGGAPERVADTARARVAGIDAETQALLDEATGRARSSTDSMGTGTTPDVAGEQIRVLLEGGRTGAKSREKAAWDAIDPDGTLTLSVGGARQRAEEILAGIPKAAQRPEAGEAGIYGAFADMPDVSPFTEIQALRNRIRTAAESERMANGRSPAHRRLVQMQEALQNDIDSIDTRAIDDFIDGPPVDRPTVDEAALKRFRAANQATRERAETFDNTTLAPITRKPAETAPYTMQPSAVPAKIFSPSPSSFDAIGRFKLAVGDEAATKALESHAIDRLRSVAMRSDGTLDPAKVATWRTQHADALRALPDLDARLTDAASASEAMASAAATRAERMKAAQAGSVGRLLGVDDPVSVSRIVGSTFDAADGASRMSSIRQAVGDDPEALQGLRRAVADHVRTKFLGTKEAGTTGVGTLKSDGFQTFVKKSRETLKQAGFADAEIDNFAAIAADLQRANRSLDAVRIPGQSNTAQDSAETLRQATPLAQLFRQMVGSGGVGVGVGLTAGGVPGIAAGLATGAIQALRQAGIRTVDDLITDALLNPERARLLLKKVPEQQSREHWNAIVRAFANSATITTAN